MAIAGALGVPLIPTPVCSEIGIGDHMRAVARQLLLLRAEFVDAALGSLVHHGTGNGRSQSSNLLGGKDADPKPLPAGASEGPGDPTAERGTWN
jgi:hypothetical protein